MPCICRDIVRATGNIGEFTTGIDFASFLKDEKTKSAVVWQIATMPGALGLKRTKRPTVYAKISKPPHCSLSLCMLDEPGHLPCGPGPRA